MERKNKLKAIYKLLIAGLIILLALLYWYGAVRQLAFVNTDMQMIDQSAYMDYARNLHESDYRYTGGRNRMPIYPLLQSLFYRPGMTDQAFFMQGKFINLILSFFLLAGITIILRNFLTWLHTLNLLLILSFTVFIFKAGYFQTELLFYFLNFCLFILMWSLLLRSSWRLAVLTGLVAGIAHLTKASILPGLLIFLLLTSIKWVRNTLHPWHSSHNGLISRFNVLDLFVVLSVGVVFLLTVYPYIYTSKRLFGRYFYNVNSTFYFWYDSWAEAKEGTRAHGDRVGWPKMPADEIPSMSRYIQEHTSNQIVERLVDGSKEVLKTVIQSYGYFKYVLIYSGVLIILSLKYWRRTLQGMRSRPELWIFLVVYFSTYFLLYSWYAPIVSSNRLILAQFLPFMFTVAYAIQALLDSQELRVHRLSIPYISIFNLALLPVLLGDIYFIITERVLTIYGGK